MDSTTKKEIERLDKDKADRWQVDPILKDRERMKKLILGGLVTAAVAALITYIQGFL